MGLKIKEYPNSIPVTIEEAKAHCRVKSAVEDTYIESLIKAATSYTEQYINRAIMPQTWELYLDKFEDTIELTFGPVQSVTSIKYYDPDSVMQTLDVSNYSTDTITNPQWVVRNSSGVWPVVASGINNIIIEFVTGDDIVPEFIKQAILFLVGHWFINRESVGTGDRMIEVPMTYYSLLAPIKKPVLA